MIFRILTFQLYPDFVYHLSHKLSMLLEEEISEYLQDFDPGFDLDFSIICNGNNENELKLGGKINHRGKRKCITQQLVIPNKFLYYEADHVFHLKSFDFKLREKGYQTYPIDKFITYTIEGIWLFFRESNIELPIESEPLIERILNLIASNRSNFLYESEEKRNLREMISKEHWAYHDGDGEEWLNSNVGEKWLRLAAKYTINANGSLELRDLD